MAESGESNLKRKSRDRGKQAIKRVPAVTRAIAILRLLGRSKEPLGVNRIARELGLVPSTTLHILRTLAADELVAFDEQTKRYEIDVGVLTLGGSAARSNSFTKAAQPGLDRLASELGLTMLGAKIMGLDHAIVVAVALSNHPMRLHTDVGSRFPALISATGRCIAAFGGYEKRVLAKQFKKLRWANPISFDQWCDQVQATKEAGYGVDMGNFLAGVSVVAVPILQGGRMTHSIVASGLHDQVAALGIERIATELRQLASEIESGAG